MSGTKERVEFPSWTCGNKGFLLKEEDVFYWDHKSCIDVILENKGQGALSAQSKRSAWTIRVFFKYLSPRAFKVGYCYKVPLLCLHCLLPSISTNGLNLMPEYHQMLRECMHEWAWGRHTGDPRHLFQSWNTAVSLFKGRMLDQSPKTTGVARNPE